MTCGVCGKPYKLEPRHPDHSVEEWTKVALAHGWTLEDWQEFMRRHPLPTGATQ